MRNTHNSGKGGFAGLTICRNETGLDGRGQDGSGMSEGGTEATGDARSNISSSELESYVRPAAHKNKSSRNTNNFNCAAAKPMSVDHVGSLLVVDVVNVLPVCRQRPRAPVVSWEE
jgi:hypothetical protein